MFNKLIIFTCFQSLIILYQCKPSSPVVAPVKKITCSEKDLSYKDLQIDSKNTTLSLKFKCGETKTFLFDNALIFYTTVLKEQMTGMQESEAGELPQRIATMKEDLKIKSYTATIAVIEHYKSTGDPTSLSNYEDLWVFLNGFWQPLQNYKNTNTTIKLVDLNGDTFQDAIVWGGCCDGTQIDFLLGSEAEILTKVDTLELVGNVTHKNNGICEKQQISWTEYGDELKKHPVIYSFNYSTNKVNRPKVKY